MLYTYQGQEPAPLPFRITLPGGATRTDPTTFSEEEIAAAGFVPAEDKPEVIYPQYVRWDGTNWVISTYDLEYQRFKKLEDLRALMAESSGRPVLDTGLGFSVDAGYTDLQSFQVGLDLGFLGVRDANNESHQVTREQLEQIIQMIKQNGLAILQIKWNLEDSIRNAQTQEELDAIDFSLLGG